MTFRIPQPVLALAVSTNLRRSIRRVSKVAVMLSIAGCASATTEPPEKQGTQPSVITQLPRALTATETRVRDASNQFSFALMSTVTDAQAAENTFISPLSASFALGMTLNGANGTSYTQMQGAMQLNGLSQAEINSGYKSLIELLVSLDPAVQLRIANSIWYRNTFSFHPAFFDSTRKYFNAEVRGLNFSDATGSLNSINGWVNTATNEKIRKVLDVIRPTDVMFLINAIYFKGSWREKFDVARTANGTFNASTGGAQTVAFMNRVDTMPYVETNTYQAVDLQYGNSAYSMTVILPKPGQDVNSVMKNFTATSWSTLSTSFRTTNVNLSLPKLKLEYQRKLNDDLQTMGMRAPFDDRLADFSKMTPEPVYITFVKQDGFVDINEEGTEAAAVTTVGVGFVSAPVTAPMRVDRPYIFVIRERLSGTVMFMGKIVRVTQ